VWRSLDRASSHTHRSSLLVSIIMTFPDIHVDGKGDISPVPYLLPLPPTYVTSCYVKVKMMQRFICKSVMQTLVRRNSNSFQATLCLLMARSLVIRATSRLRGASRNVMKARRCPSPTSRCTHPTSMDDVHCFCERFCEVSRICS